MNGVARYARTSRALHWTMAAMVLAMLLIGMSMVASLGSYHRLLSAPRPRHHCGVVENEGAADLEDRGCPRAVGLGPLGQGRQRVTHRAPMAQIGRFDDLNVALG